MFAGGKIGGFNLFNVCSTAKETDPLFGSVSLLMPFNGDNNSTNFIDVKGNTLTRTGTPVISTTQSRFGNSSGAFLNTGNVSVNNSGNNSNFLFSNAAFAVEFWTYIFDSNVQNTFVCKSDFVNNLRSWAVSYENSSSTGFKVHFYSSTNGGTPSALILNPLTANTWNHVAFTRSGNTLSGYINGILINTANLTGVTYFNNTTIPVTIGSYANNTQPGNCYIDDLRITKATRTIILPTSAYPNS